MANRRFPPAGTPAWYSAIERQIMQDDVDDKRQWGKLRQAIGIVTGLDPVQDIVDLRFPTTSTTTAVPCGGCIDVECFETTFPLTFLGTGGVGSCSGDTHAVLPKVGIPANCEWGNAGDTSDPTILSIVLRILTGNNWYSTMTVQCGSNTPVTATYERVILPGDCESRTLDFVSGDSNVTWPSTITFDAVTCP